MRTQIVTCFTVGFLALAGLASAQQEDSEGCKDHPMFTRMPSYYIAHCEDQEFSVFEFTIGPDTTRKVEGHLWKLDFEIKEGAKVSGPLQIGRNYWNVMAGKGGKRLLEQLDSGGGMMAGTMPGPKGGTVWLQVEVANNGEMYTLNVVQEEGMRQDVELTTKDLADAIAKTGSVTLNNILFDTGKATLKTESEAPLTIVADLLKGDAALKLEIQGHTDNVGAKAANLKLSKDRAESVKAYLVKAGVAAARLTTAGLGDAQPVADNKAEEGRAQNRRVVLVKKS